MKKTLNFILLPLLLIVLVLMAVMVLTPNKKTDAFTQELTQMQTVSASNNLEDIQSDIDSTDLDNLDNEFSELDNLLK